MMNKEGKYHNLWVQNQHVYQQRNPDPDPAPQLPIFAKVTNALRGDPEERERKDMEKYLANLEKKRKQEEQAGKERERKEIEMRMGNPGFYRS